MAAGDVSIQFNYPTSFVLAGALEGTLNTVTLNGDLGLPLEGSLGGDLGAGELTGEFLSGTGNEFGSGSLQ